jgi:hypothetical protein
VEFNCVGGSQIAECCVKVRGEGFPLRRGASVEKLSDVVSKVVGC